VYPKEYETFVRYFNRGEYELAYEALLGLWQRHTTQRFYKGLIQVAGAYRHWEDGNLFGAASLFHSAFHMLKEFAPQHQGMQIDRLLPQLEACLHQVLRQEENREARVELPVIQLQVEGLTDRGGQEAGT